MAAEGARGAVGGDGLEMGGIGAVHAELRDVPVQPFALEVGGGYVCWFGMVAAEAAKGVVADYARSKGNNYGACYLLIVSIALGLAEAEVLVIGE